LLKDALRTIASPRLLVDKPNLEPHTSTSVTDMEKLDKQEEILKVCKRLRSLREAKALTLLDVEQQSEGEVTAVALGSYERGHRQMSVSKLLQIARIYGVPVSDILTQKAERVEPTRITIDLRKIGQSAVSESVKLVRVLNEIAQMRGDWNGELISIRADDLTNFSLFTGLSAIEIHSCISKYSIPRSK
jgi:transcriptional regulator with XRE-family HTH domain